MSKRIYVTGDFVMDHHIYQGQRSHFADAGQGVREVEELGGARLIDLILQHLHGTKTAERTLSAIIKESDAIPDECQAYAYWRPQAKDSVWRVSEKMGYGGHPYCKPTIAWPKHQVPRAKQDIVAISDGGHVFRDQVSKALDALLGTATRVVLKTCAPLMDGALWNKLSTKKLARKLVVIVAASELRKTQAQISRGLSWEETLETLAAELKPRGVLAKLAQCRHLIVTFESEGALWIDRSKNTSIANSPCHFIYQASAIEGDHREQCEGSTFGSTSCLTASIVRALAQDGEEDFEDAIEGGLSAMHDLLEHGHGDADKEADGFPAERLANVITDATCRYSRATMPLSALCRSKKTQGYWSLLHAMRQDHSKKHTDPAYDLAKMVLKRGTIALESLPHLKVGALMSVDRREIESMRTLSRIITDYKSRSKADKPLSLGVFGPPGSGKSFTVKQIAQTLLGKKGWLEFNLSQFSGPEDLIGAFHQIRDAVLKGLNPVAFFDEFDSQEYLWLQYLLAPMQDGCFQEGQITHPIGQCVFIFAGGTSRSFETFGPPDPSKNKKSGTNETQKYREEDAYLKFKYAKGPDFMSRLDGFLNVSGPNRRVLPADRNDGEDSCDIFFPIRRAFIARGGLRCKAHQHLSIDEGLLHAIVRAERYKHGSRSLSKVIEPLKNALPDTLRRSLIPPHGQLALHLENADKFITDSQYTPSTPPVHPLSSAQETTVAKIIHTTWEKLGLKEGWRDKKDNKMVPFGTLSTFFENSNRAAAQRMPEILALLGLELEKGENTDAQIVFVQHRIEYYLELLAETEHSEWMKWHLSQGWKHGKTKDPAKLNEEPQKKTHPCLRPYAELSDEERNKDRNTIRHYPDYAKKAGMKFVGEGLPNAQK